MKTIEFLDASGHIALTWDPSSPASVEKAGAEFETLQRSGYSFFRIVENDQVTEFQPELGALVVERVADPSEVKPRLEPEANEPTPVASVRNKPGPKPGGKRQERVVAARPMRGG